MSEIEIYEIIKRELDNYPPVLVANDVSRILRVGRVRAYELMKTGEIRSFRLGVKNIRTTKEDVIEYLRRQREEVS